MITINNYSQEEIDRIMTIPAKYSTYALEIGDQGTSHLHAVIVFRSQRHFNAVKKLFPRAHLDIVKAIHSAIEYVQKEGDFKERGERPLTSYEQGQLNVERYAAALTAAKAGQLDDIPADLLTRHYQTYKRIKVDYQALPPDLEEVTGIWIYGATGTGKSFKCKQDYPGAYYKRPTKWWDGYQDQDFVVIEDFDKRHDYLVHDLKIWADRYSFPAEIKGGQITLRPKKIIITSNYSPEDIWYNEADIRPIMRRFNIIKL